MSAMHQPMSVQHLEILADGDLGGVELPRHVRDQDTAIPFQKLDNGPPAFFVEQVFPETRAYDCTFFLYRLLSVVQSKREEWGAAPEKMCCRTLKAFMRRPKNRFPGERCNCVEAQCQCPRRGRRS